MTDVKIVIGKNFGDEGKGLAVDYFCQQAFPALVIKHNGGAQAGHTVTHGNQSFVFHQLSSGSFQNAITYWDEQYYADLYKLEDEIQDFYKISGKYPKIICSPNTPTTYIDDVLVNRLLEASRGESRHGSCGMGINEAYLRHNAGYKLTIEEIQKKPIKDLVAKLQYIRYKYVFPRLKELHLLNEKAVYMELLNDSTVLCNSVAVMKQNAENYVTVLENPDKKFFHSFPLIIFESGQGLMLDQNNKKYLPHVTASNTGLTNPLHLIKKKELPIGEIIYVTRTYVTRHGAGMLPYECDASELGNIQEDRTNKENDWQGKLRYAKHGTKAEFLEYVKKDLKEIKQTPLPCKVSLFVTHCNETNNLLVTCNGNVELEKAKQATQDIFQCYYWSSCKSSLKERKVIV